MQRSIIAAALACAVLAAAPAYAETGLASFYGFESGTKTASGERFNPLASGPFTCAHKTRPFGQMVEVRTDRGSIRCKINDRGPFVAGRIIDLNLAAARALGIEAAGVVPVSVTP